MNCLNKIKITSEMHHNSFEQCPECRRKKNTVAGYAADDRGYLVVFDCDACGTRYYHHSITEREDLEAVNAFLSTRGVYINAPMIEPAPEKPLKSYYVTIMDVLKNSEATPEDVQNATDLFARVYVTAPDPDGIAATFWQQFDIYHTYYWERYRGASAKEAFQAAIRR